MAAEELIKTIKENYKGVYITNEDYLKECEGVSERFIRYFNELTGELSMPVYLFSKIDMTVPMSTMSYRNEGYAVMVKGIPDNEYAVTELAHELGYLYYSDKKYPMAVPKDGRAEKMYLATVLTNTVLDPLINRRVDEYGFDYISYMKENINVMLPMIKYQAPSEKELEGNPEFRHYLKCVLIEKLLEWKIVGKRLKNKFESAARMKYPLLLEECRSFARFMEETGMDTPEKAAKIMDALLRENHMENELVLTA